MKTHKTRMPLILQGNSSPAREQGWMENESNELIETGFRRWVIRNFSELKEHVLTQCKETRNLEKRLQELLTRITSLERNVNNMELKCTAWELCEAYSSINSWINQAEERISEFENHLAEIRHAEKIREKGMKRNKQNLWEIQDYVKKTKPKTELEYLKETGRMEPSWKTHFKILSRKPSPT